MHPSGRCAIVAAALTLFASGVALASCGGDPESSATSTGETTTETTSDVTTTTEAEAEQPTVVRIVVVNGAPKGGIVRKSVDKGGRVVIVVKSDGTDEVHLHGYDIRRDVAAGGTARIEFRAKIPGRFEVELEDRGTQIADLTVE